MGGGGEGGGGRSAAARAAVVGRDHGPPGGATGAKAPFRVSLRPDELRTVLRQRQAGVQLAALRLVSAMAARRGAPAVLPLLPALGGAFHGHKDRSRAVGCTSGSSWPCTTRRSPRPPRAMAGRRRRRRWRRRHAGGGGRRAAAAAAAETAGRRGARGAQRLPPRPERSRRGAPLRRVRGGARRRGGAADAGVSGATWGCAPRSSAIGTGAA